MQLLSRFKKRGVVFAFFFGAERAGWTFSKLNYITTPSSFLFYSLSDHYSGESLFGGGILKSRLHIWEEIFIAAKWEIRCFWVVIWERRELVWSFT